MTQLERLKGNVFIGLFGKVAGLKLLHWLDPCCNTFCTDVNFCVASNSGTAVNTTGDVSAEAIIGGLLTSTSVGAVTATLPTASDLASTFGASQGTVIDFIVDNSAGANTVTVAVNTGITVGTAPITGGDTLTVSTANVVGYFRLIFTSTTSAILRRIA